MAGFAHIPGPVATSSLPMQPDYIQNVATVAGVGKQGQPKHGQVQKK